MKKVVDLLKHLDKNLTGIDTYFNEYVGYGVDDMMENGYTYQEILNMELTRELEYEIKEYVMGFFDKEGFSMMGEI